MKCGHCSTDVPRPRSNQKWCRRCAALMGISALHQRPSQCRTCRQKFYKIQRHDVVCYDHDWARQHHEPCPGPCLICGETRAGPAAPGIALCFRCAMDPDPVVARNVAAGVDKLLAALVVH